MSERFKELVLKTSDGATHREFESHTLRQQKADHTVVGFLGKIRLKVGRVDFIALCAISLKNVSPGVLRNTPG